MKITIRRSYFLIFLGIFIAILVTFLVTTGKSQAEPMPPEPKEPEELSIDWADAKLLLSKSAHLILPSRYTAATLPPPEQDPCLHCHITGEEKGLWTPLVR